MALAPEKLYTTDDIYALPDGERAENWQLYMNSRKTMGIPIHFLMKSRLESMAES